MDQLMNFAWKFMLPMSLINIVGAGVWHFMPAGFARWIVVSLIIAFSCILLSRGLRRNKWFHVRTYRYASS
jgi:NADH-quinone oxidoreductase subunit H